MTPIRIGFVLRHLDMGGVPRWILSQAAAHHPGFSVREVVFTRHQAFDSRLTRALLAHGVRVVYAGTRKAYRVYPARVERERLGAVQQMVDDCDVIHLVGFLPEDVPWLEQVDFRGRPVVLTAHGSCTFTTRTLATLQSFGTHFCAVSRAAAAAYPASLRPHVTVLPIGIDLNRSAASRPREEVRRQLGAEADDVLVGYIGRWVREKNLLLVPRAVRVLPSRYRAVLVGGGPRDRRFSREARRILGRRLSLVPYVEHIGDILHALDVVVLASQSEGSPLVWLEAAAAGRPFVATPVGNIIECEEEFGPLVVRVPLDPSPEQLAEAVLEATRPELAPRWDAARRMVISRHSLPRALHLQARYFQQITR